jgi:hypothetical protein
MHGLFLVPGAPVSRLLVPLFLFLLHGLLG